MRTISCAVCGRLIEKHEPRLVERVRLSFMDALMRFVGVRRQAEEIIATRPAIPLPTTSYNGVDLFSRRNPSYRAP